MARSASERTDDVLRRRAINQGFGLTFTSANVEILDVRLEAVGNELRVHATEQITLGFQSTQYAHDAARDQTISRIPHTFVFGLSHGKWLLLRDEADPFPTNKEKESMPAGRTAAIQPPAGRREEPVSGGRLASPLQAGWYDWVSAQNYMRSYALSPNPSYRDFSGTPGGGDCTNFVSQVVKAGGWWNRDGFYWDWSAWWYDSLGTQTRTWTYTNAFNSFFNTSGRGVFLSYLTDMVIGDIMQISFNGNGTIDHSMAVDDRYGAYTSGIFMSYHTTNTFHKPLSDVLAIYTIPPASYWAMHPTGTNP